MQYAIYALIGLGAGVLSGFFGIGGGIIVVPLLILLAGYDQLRAQGTSIGVLLAPIGILAFLEYWKNPAVKLDFVVIVIIALAMAVGGFFGGKLANTLDVTTMRKAFAVFLVAVGVYQFLRPGH